MTVLLYLQLPDFSLIFLIVCNYCTSILQFNARCRASKASSRGRKDCATSSAWRRKRHKWAHLLAQMDLQARGVHQFNQVFNWKLFGSAFADNQPCSFLSHSLQQSPPFSPRTGHASSHEQERS